MLRQVLRSINPFGFPFPFQVVESDRCAKEEKSEFDNLSEERWLALQEEMDRYFKFPLVLFPDVGWQKSIFDGLEYFFPIKFASERIYFSYVYGQSIRAFFPRDECVRRVITKFRQYHNSVIPGYVLMRRIHLAVALILVGHAIGGLSGDASALSTNLGSHAGDFAFALAGAVLLVFGLYVGRFLFLSALTTSCVRVSQVVQGRTGDLINTYNAIPDSMLTGEQEDPDEWPTLASRWMKILVWIAKRAEHIERHIQREMWSIYQNRMVWKAGGIFLYLTVMGIFVALEYTHFVHIGLDLQNEGTLAALGILVAAAALSWFSVWYVELPVTLVEENLQAHHWNLYNEFKLHDVLGRIVENDKKKIIQLRDIQKPSSTKFITRGASTAA